MPNNEDPSDNVVLEAILVGSGPSTSTPMLTCNCKCCADAVSSESSPNRRFNSSLLLRTKAANILIDCGKSFYSGALKTLRPNGIFKIDYVLITHGHADAILGLDDLRHYTHCRSSVLEPLIVYCEPETFNIINATFPYLVDTKAATGSGEVADMRFQLFYPNLANADNANDLYIHGLRITALPVEHGIKPNGEPFYALGFLIHAPKVIYISDVSKIPEAVHSLIQSICPNPNVLIIDCLHPDGSYISHFGWPDCRKTIQRLNPKKTILIGMSHHIEYHAFNQTLPTGVECGYDGMRINTSP